MAPESKQDKIPNKLENIKFEGVSVDDAKKLKDFVEDKSVNDTKIKEYLNGKTKEAISDNKEIKDALKLVYNSLPDGEDKKELETLAVFLYGTDPLENGTPTLDKDFRNIDKSSKEFKEFQNKSITNPESKQTNIQEQKVDEKQPELAKQEKAEVKAESLNLPKTFKFYQTKIDGKYQSITKEDINGLSTLLNNIEGGDKLIGLLNKGEVKEFQTKIGMIEKDKNKENNADGFFGVRTFNNLKTYANSHNKETEKKEEQLVAPIITPKPADETKTKDIETDKSVENKEEKLVSPIIAPKTADETKTKDIETDKSVEQKAKLEEAALKSSIIDVEKTIRDFATNGDGSIDRKKVSSFGLNMGKLGFFSYESFSKALNTQLLKDKQTIIDQNKGIKETDIDKDLQKAYQQKIEEMTKGDLPAGTTFENYFSSADQTYNHITGAYMNGTYKSEGQGANAYKIQNDQDLGIDKEKETSTEELTTQEMKRASKDVIKFLNSESLSSQERKEIRFFIRTIANIDRKTINDKSIEKDILDYFASNPSSLSFTKENRMEPNRIKGLTIKEGDARRLQKLNQLYYQAMNGQNQTLRRLFFIIQQEGSVNDVKTSFDGSSKKAKEQEKYIKQQSNKFETDTYQIGETLGYQKEDLAKAKAYLSTIESSKRNETKTIINAITDFDLNGFINHKDSGNKTGLQVKEIISHFGEDNSLENIISLANKILTKSDLTEKITKENLLSDPAYLVLVQNTLKNPAFDITDIVRYGDKVVENIYNLSDKSTEILNTQSDKVINELKKLGVPVEAGLKDIVTTAILKAYSDHGYGLGISLDSFIKGLSFNLGLAHFPQGKEDFGINIGRNGRTNLGKGREATGGVSVGSTLVFIPMASAQGGFIKTLDNKKQSTSLDVKTIKKIQISGHVIVMPGYEGYGASMGMEKSKRDSILEQQPKLQSELKTFFAKILEPKEGDKTFKFNKTELAAKLQTELKNSFKNSKPDTLTKAVNNMSLILASYDGLAKEKIPEASAKIAESYTNARANQSANDIDNKLYLGGAGLSVTFFEGIVPIVGILTFKKNKITSYNDSNPELMKSSENSGEGNETYKDGIGKIIEEINKNIGSEIRIEGNFITIPKATRTEKNLEIRINENMKGLVKTDKDGNLILDKDTPIRFFDAYLSDRGRKVLNIGEFSSTENDKKLNKFNTEIQKDFLTDKEIDKEKLPLKIDLNTENINGILDNLRNQSTDKENNSLKDIKAELIGGAIIFKDLDKEIGKLENITNQSKINITKKTDGSLVFEKLDNKDQKRLTIQFIENSENSKTSTPEIITFDEIDNTNDIISKIYSEGREINDNLFHNIIHNEAGKKIATYYKDFNDNLNLHEYANAKDNLISILDSINTYTKNKYAKESFASTRESLTKLTDEYQTVKVLSAFNVLFSRVANVKIENGKYTYFFSDQPTTGEKIIEENENRIKDGREYHKGGFTEQFKAYRPKESKDLTKENVDSLFAKIKSERAKSTIDFNKQEQTENTISFNHGNPQDYFKLQINPEIISNSKIKIDDLKDENNGKFIEDLKSSYINQLIQTEDKLLNGMLNKLGIKEELSIEQKKQLFMVDGLDLDGKIYKLDFDQYFGYNPECNNLVRLMEELKINIRNKIKEEQKYEAILEGNGLAINYGETNSKINMQEKRFSIAGGFALKNNKQPTTTPGEEEVPMTTPGEKEVPMTTPGETPGGTTTTPTGGPGQTGHQEGGRD